MELSKYKKMLFVTSNNLTTNPRLFKELQAVSGKKEFIGFRLGNWSDSIDKGTELVSLRKYYLDTSKKSIVSWLISGVVEKLAKRLYPFFPKSIKLAAYATSKRSFLLHRFLRKHKSIPEFVVAHNLPALYPAYKFAVKHKIPLFFDVEDYYPGERCSLLDKQLREFLMRTLLPKCQEVTFASPLIKLETEKLMGKQYQECAVVNNSFFSSEFSEPLVTAGGKLKFVWFSQNIAAGRGLEEFLAAADDFTDSIELTLIGNAYSDFTSKLLQGREYVYINEPLLQSELHKKLSEYDVGLALEISKVDINKNAALSNKIFAYAQAGLHVLATNTDAQKLFMADHPVLGLVCGQTVNEMKEAIKGLIINKADIQQSGTERFEYSKRLAFENEIPKLRKIWEL